MNAAQTEGPHRSKLARVAEEVGYGSESAFSRALIREMGAAPTKLHPHPNGRRRAERSA